MSGAENKNISLLREQVNSAHRLLEGTMNGVTTEQVHWSPPGTAMPLGAHYAHVVISEDGAINGMIKRAPPLCASTWAGKVGVSEFPPMPNPEKPGFPDWNDWSRKVEVDLGKLQEYAQAVYAATDECLASMTDGDLDGPVDLSALGIGEHPVSYLLINGVIGNAYSHCGEISCLKGLQGSRGYPGG